MKRTIKDFDLEGMRVIIRCDLNVPMTDNVIDDDTRIKSSLRTIKYAIDNGARVILLSHLGKVKVFEDKEKNSLYPVSIRLSEYLGQKVIFSSDTCSDNLTNMVNNLKNGEVLLVENTRFEDLNDKRESNCDLSLADYWASLGDIFINDAYGSCHRSHASVTGIPKFLPSGVGFLVEKEINKINSVLDSDIHPFIVILGGKKVDDKITLIDNLVKIADKVLIGGAMSFTFLKVLGYNVGKSIVSYDHIDFCKNILDSYGDKIILPSDFIVLNNNGIITKNIGDFSDDDVGYDIGYDTILLFENELKEAKRVIINGPMGLFEDDRFLNGTKKVFEILIKNKIKTVVGGGDSAAAVNKFGFESNFYHVSTGGGATMKYLEDRNLVGIEVIDDEKTQN
ncbi:MAG: phosphoglycerate kinase [Bacilli bacterium]|nr:phosphoglycerate kinase [Bacilli bacterium]